MLEALETNMSREYNTATRNLSNSRAGIWNLSTSIIAPAWHLFAGHRPASKAARIVSVCLIELLSTFSSHTSFALCCIRISLSISCTCCSSLNANAHGTPNSSALVLTTHSVLPPKLSALDAQSYPVDVAFAMLLR